MKRKIEPARKDVRPAAERKAPMPHPKPAQEPVKGEQGRGWDGSIVVKEDIFGNKWASS